MTQEKENEIMLQGGRNTNHVIMYRDSIIRHFRLFGIITYCKTEFDSDSLTTAIIAMKNDCYNWNSL